MATVISSSLSIVANGHDCTGLALPPLPPKPTAVQGDLKNLPEALALLKAKRHWVVWKWEPRFNQKRGEWEWTKPPFQSKAPGRHASSKDAATWGTYEESLAAFEAGQCDGIGFCVLNSDFPSLDLDDCRNKVTGEITAEALKIVHRASTYVEVSPSGEGLRVIGLGTGLSVQRTLRLVTGKVEIYRDTPRYFTVTGAILKEHSFPGGLGNIDQLVDDLIKELSSDVKGQKATVTPLKGTHDLPRELQDLISHPTGPDRSEDFFHAVCWLGDLGHSAEQIERLVAEQPITPERYNGRLGDQIKTCLSKAKPPIRNQNGRKDQQGDEAVLETRPASSFKPRAISWLWPDRFALGKLALIGGMPDRGKGLISADMIACATADQPLPCDEGHMPQGNVIYFTAEDGIEDTVVPRLLAAGADLDRVHIVQTMRNKATGKRRPFNIVTDLPALRSRIEEVGNVVLSVIDPMSAYVGVGKVNTSMTTEVRGFLQPLSDLADEKSVSVIGIMHFNKKADVSNAMLRIADSLAYVAAARHVYFVVDDPEVKNRRFFCKAKNNLAPDKKALSYMTGLKLVAFDEEQQKEIWAPHIIWGAEHVEISATEAMQAEAGTKGSESELRQAKEFLEQALGKGPVRQPEIIEEAEANDISERTLRRAKKELGVKSSRKKGVADEGHWVWELPPK
jgi:hypothetical protein